VYVHVLDQMRGLNRRVPGDLLNRNNRGSFHTVSADRFRNGPMGNRGRSAEWENIDRPWQHGDLVKGRLNVQPTAASFRAVPDRQAVQPPPAARALPSVVRTSPGANLRGQGQFNRIINPQIPSLPPRGARQQNEQRGADSGNGTRPNARVVEAPPGDRPGPGVQNPPENTPGDQGERRSTPYRRPGASRDNGGNSGAGANSEPGADPQTKPPVINRNGPVWRYDGRPPQREQTQQPPPEAAPHNEDRVITNRNEPHSDGEGRSNNNGPVIRNTPRANTGPAVNEPKESKPSSERNHGARSDSAPSSNRGGGDRSPSAGKSSDSGNSKEDNSGSQKPSDRGASDSGGGRK
jgi:hypothetical protein